LYYDHHIYGTLLAEGVFVVRFLRP